MEPETRNSKLETVSVFFGDANDALARVYARLEAPRDELTGLTLAGRVVGPFCQYANTLPAQVPLTDKGAGEGLLAEAIVPDPCFWTPELPFLYRVQVELRRDNEVLQTAERPLGIRRLGARGKDLFLEGKRYVVRGVRCDEASAMKEIGQFHDQQTALCVNSPGDALCEDASRLGVLLIAEVKGDLAAELTRLSRWAAVGIAVVAQGTDVSDAVRAAAPNLLFAQRAADFKSARPWAQLILADAASDPSPSGRGQGEGAPDQLAMLAKNSPLPILAQRRLPEPQSLNAARAACDRLQADLAPLGDFAGYLV